MDGVFPIGFYVGNALAGPIKHKFGYLYNFGLGMLMTLLGFFYVAFFLPDSIPIRDQRLKREAEDEIEELVETMLEGLESQPLESIVAGKTVIESLEKVVLLKTDLRINNLFLKKVKGHFLASHEMKTLSGSTEKTKKLKGKSHF